MKIVTSLCIFFFGMMSAPLFAQTMNWTEITSDFDLPEAIHIYDGQRSEPTTIRAWYAEVDLFSDDYLIKPVVSPEGLEQAQEYGERESAHVTINGGYFSGSSSLSTIITDGNVFARNLTSVTRNGESHPVMRGTLSWTADSSISIDWIYHFGSALTDFYRYDAPLGYTANYSAPLAAPEKENGDQFTSALMSVGGGPTIIRNGTKNVTWAEELFDAASGVDPLNPQPRTIIGYTDQNTLILMVIDGRDASGSQGLSLPDIADELLPLGVMGAINLDGGGSSQIAVGGQQLNRLFRGEPQPSRNVPTFVTVVPNKSQTPDKNEAVILDTDSTEVVSVRGGWFETANSGFYGTSPSIIVPVGDGSSTVSYFPELEEAEYEVYGWWVASFNRATDTPYIISHADGIDTVRADQTTDNAQWKLLGSYNFTGTESDSVMISNQASGDDATYAVADAIRFKPVVDTSVDDLSTGETRFPDIITLKGNYPNPFNPTTTIRFSLSQKAETTLEIFNALGQKLYQTQHNYPSGTHSISWNASGSSSGIYFYRVNAQTDQQIISKTGSMTLIK